MNKRPVCYDESEGIAWTFTPQGDKVIVSWADRKWVEDYSVCQTGDKRYPYAGINYQSKCQCIHRLIMESQGYQGIFDHIDRDRFNNRRENLRPATLSMNSHNVPKRANTSSKFLGVTWNKQRNKWQTEIKFKANGKRKRKFLGRFTSELDAARAYDRAVAIYQSPGATTNASLGLL